MAADKKNVKRKSRPQAPGTHAPDNVAAMIRVDHAGEYGAVRIYEGQLAVLRRRKDSAASAAVEKMAKQEERHLRAFDAIVNQRKVRPTALEPVWRIAGFGLGALTAFLGDKAAMACTAAVEEVIDDHYAGQLERLNHEPALKATIAEFRAEEIAHRDEAIAHGAQEAPGYRLLSGAVKAGCRLAIKLSEHI